MKIVLIGFMGAGKTTLAKLLAKEISQEYIDMDELLVKKSGRSSIEEIFQKDGEIHFRELEISLAKELQNRDKVIISAGGGIVMNKIILDYLKQNSTVIFLKNSFETSQKRINNNSRPLFKDKKKAQALYELRLPLYTHYADTSIETDNKTKQRVVSEIMNSL